MVKEMNGTERRKQLLVRMRESKAPLSGSTLGKETGVSRQVIVQDIALLRAKDYEIMSTNRGYVLTSPQEYSRVFKVIHTDEQVEEELQSIIDLGGWVKDVFVYHKVYGVVKADMNLHSRRDIAAYMKELESGKSSLLKNVTSGYHYHTVVARDEKTLDLIQEALADKGFLAKLQEYEPVNFWEE